MTQPVDEATSGEEHANAYDQLARLYVAGIPKSVNEAQLKSLFDQWGAVRDVMILRERSTGLSRGCAFVGYESAEEAQAAISNLDRRVHLPSALGPLEVRFARGRPALTPGSGEDARQCAFSGAPASAGEDAIRELFSRCGAVDCVSLELDPDTKQSKGSGVVTMSSPRAATAAAEALDGTATLDGAAAPLSVCLADPEPRRGGAAGGPGGDADDRTVFFARVLRSATEDAVRQLFSRFGRVAEVNLFRAFQGAPTTKGCGLVTMATVEEASAAIVGLHELHTWQGMAQPMVVRWMDSALQRRRREEHQSARQAAAAAAPIGYFPMPPAPHPAGPRGAPAPAAPPGVPQLGPLAAPAAPGLFPQHSPLCDLGAAPIPAPYGAQLLAPPLPTEVPPPGCAPDAYKLFVGNVPSVYTERDLRPLFESVGPVVELVVLYDKQTGASKGSAFCWYASRADADRAAHQLNERHLLPDPTGHQQRPLVVRPATVRRAVPRAALMGAGAAGALGAGALGAAALAPHFGGGLHQHQHQQRAAAAAPGGMGRLMHPMVLSGADSAAAGLSGSFLVDNSAAYAAAAHGDVSDFASGRYALAGGGAAGAAGDSGCYAVLSGGVVSGGVGSGGSGATSGGALGVAGGAAWDSAPGGALQYVPVAAGAAAPRPAAPPAGDQLVTVQVPVLAAQLNAVTPHVFNIQSASGAEVVSQAVAPGVFCLRLSGTKLAVDTASQLISSVIQPAA